MAIYARSLRFVLLALLAGVGLSPLGCLKDREPTAPTEIDRPSSRTITPGPGTLIVPRNTPVRLHFTEPMDAYTFPGHFTLRDWAGAAVEGMFQAADTDVVFTPLAPLQSATRYAGELRGRVRDRHGSSLQINGEPVLDETTLVASTWFFTEGEYSTNGFAHCYVRDRKEGSVQIWRSLDSLVRRTTGLRATEGIAVTPDGASVWVALTAVDSVAQLDGRTGAIVNRVKVPSYPSSMAIQGGMLYVICINAKQIVRINAATGSVEGTMTLTFFPGKLAVSTDGLTLYTLDQQTRDLVLLRSSDGGVIRKIPGAVNQAVLGELAMHPSTGRLYLCNAKGLNLKTTDQSGTALEIVQTFPTGAEPIQVAFDANAYYVAAGKSLYRFDAQSGASLGTLDFTSALKAVGVLPGGEAIYVAYGLSIVVIDARSFTMLREIPITSSGIEAIVPSPIKF